MNISRVTTISLALAVAVFALGYATPSFAAKPVCDPPDVPPHPSCKDDGGGGQVGDDATYSWFIVGDMVMGNSLEAFPWSTGGGKKTINGRQHNAGVLTDLSFFAELDGGPFTAIQGNVCFPPDNDFPLIDGIITQKKGDAEVSFWFEGNTYEGGHKLFYQLHFTGDFGSDWLPVDSTVLTIHSWSLTATNVGNDIKAISCIGEGSIGVRPEDIQFVFITVTAL